MEYKIPILSIQNTLMGLSFDNRVHSLRHFCDVNIEPDYNFKIDVSLEHRWFPVVETNSVWLADKIMKKFVLGR